VPRKSNIEIQGLVERILEMVQTDNMTHAAIADKLRLEGYAVSKSGVGRAIVKAEKQAQKFKASVKKAALLIQELRKVPGYELNEASVQLATVKLAEELEKFENFEELKPMQLLQAITKMTDSQTKISRVKLEFEKGYKQGLFKAAEAAEKEARKAGLSDGTINQIKVKILGLPVAKNGKKDE